MELTDEKFANFMQKYDLLKHNVSDDSCDKARIGSNKTATIKLLNKYGFNNFELDDNENIYESDVLQFVEYETGRNTFPYSKEACMEASAKAAAKYNSRGKEVPSNISLIDAYSQCIKNEEIKWHSNTGISSLNAEANRYTDIYNLYNNKKLQNGQKLKEILTTANQYFDNQYIKLLSIAIELDNISLQEKINKDFANYKRLNSIELGSNSSWQKSAANEKAYQEAEDIPKTGKGAAYRNGTFYGYDYTGMHRYSSYCEDEIAKAMEAGSKCVNKSIEKSDYRFIIK